MKIILILFALVLSFVAGNGWAADPLAIPGSRISLVPPTGFVLSKEFAGLQGENASVLVVEIPGAPYDTLTTAIQSGAMAQQGVEITGGEELTGLPFRARMFRGKQKAQGGADVNKWLMLVDGPALTPINVSALKDANTLTEDTVKDMFRSVRVAATTAGDPIDALPFAITASPRFPYRQALAGNGLIVTMFKPSPAEKNQSGLVISRTFQLPVPKAQWNQAVAAFVKSSQALKFDKVEDPTPIKVGDLEGLQFMATGTSVGDPVKTLVVMVFTPTGGYTMVAMAPPERFDAALLDFRAMMASFHLK
jgi:hypothetical protein